MEACNNQLQVADKSLQGFNLSIIPVSSSKIPTSPWKPYQTSVAPVEKWLNHFQNQGTVGIITGWLNIECIDIDVKNDPTKTIFIDYKALIPEELYSRLIVQTTPNHGFHLIYRCPETVIEGNQKLALHSNKEVIIETRGEGGYFCTNKINNQILQGQFDLSKPSEIIIPIITPEERELLLETARSLTRYFPPVKVAPATDNSSISKNVKSFQYSDSAINDFNNKYSILDLFLKHDWSQVNEDEDKVYLKRKGSLAPHSAYYFKDSMVFYCFSTSTEFKAEQPYNHFQVLQVLEGKNDYRTTLRLLPELGFNLQNTNTRSESRDKVTADDIAEFLNEKGVRYDAFIQDLTIDGKIIEEMEYNTLFIDLKKHFDKTIPRCTFEEIIKSDYIIKFNPIEEFIEMNIHRNPSGTFDKWLDCIVLKNKHVKKESVLHFLKKWYVGMIAQALGGKFSNEYFLTLLSTNQGIGKTTFLREYVLPKELLTYRKEHPLSTDDDFKVIMSQALLVVDDEMDGRSYEMEKTFKSILSTSELTMRRKYDRRISTIKRRCSFAGSGNHLQIVREVGNRRVIPLEVEKFDYDLLSQMDLTDLFMEAYHLYIGGFQYSYQKSDQQILKELDDDYVLKSDVDMVLDECVQLPQFEGDSVPISNLDLVSTLLRTYPYFAKRINVPTIGKLMAERGFDSKKRGQNKATYYIISATSKVLRFRDDYNEEMELL
jgi:hypothetical protein